MPTSPYRNPPPGSPSSGQAIPLPAAYQALNTSTDPNAGIKKYVDDFYQKTGILPQAFKVENGHAVEQEPGFLFRNPWLFPVIGVTAGLALAPVVGGVAASTVGPATAANVAGTSSVVGGAAVPPSLAAGGGGAAMAGLSYADLLKYGLPVAGNLIGGVIQARASGAASDAQQRYLEEALAYQKEQDAYARTTDAAHYADSRGDLATALAKEERRYGDYQGRIAPFVANGISSNDRMAALLGLPARAPGAGVSSRSDSSAPAVIGTGPTFDPTYIGQQLDAEYAKHGLTATGPGTGPTDKAYFIDAIRNNKGWDAGYWSPRIADELRKAGIADRPGSSPAASSAPPAASAPPLTTQPQARSSAVKMRAPDGSTQTVPADQVAHYQQLGATVIGAAA